MSVAEVSKSLKKGNFSLVTSYGHKRQLTGISVECVVLVNYRLTGRRRLTSCSNRYGKYFHLKVWNR